MANENNTQSAKQEATVLEMGQQAEKYNLQIEIKARIEELQRDYADNPAVQELAGELASSMGAGSTPDSLRRAINRAIEVGNALKAQAEISKENRKEALNDAITEASYGKITDANRRDFFNNLLGNGYSETQRDFFNGVMNHQGAQDIINEYNKNSPEANEAAKKRAQENKEFLKEAKDDMGVTWDPRQQAFASMLERCNLLGDPRAHDWIVALRNDEITDEMYKEVRGAATKASIGWEKLRNAQIEELAKTRPAEAAFAREHAEDLWAHYQKYQETYKTEEFQDLYKRYSKNPEIFNSLTDEEKKQIVAHDVIIPTQLLGMTKGIAESAARIDTWAKKLESSKGEGLSGDSKKVYDALNGITDPHQRQEVLVKLAMELDGQIAKFSQNEKAFEKARAAYLAGYVDDKASAVVQGVDSKSLVAVAKTEPVTKAIKTKEEYEKTHATNDVEADKKAFFADIKTMLTAERKAAEAQAAKGETVRYPFTATLSEISGYQVYSPATIALVDKIKSGALKDGDEAYRQWQTIKDKDYDATVEGTKKNISEQLKADYPGLVARLNRVDFEKNVDPLIKQMNTDGKFADYARGLADDMVGNKAAGIKPKDWGAFTDKEQATLVAYMAKNPVHMASDSLCSYGPGGVCHMPNRDKGAHEKAGLAQGNEATKDTKETKPTTPYTSTLVTAVVAVNPIVPTPAQDNKVAQEAVKQAEAAATQAAEEKKAEEKAAAEPAPEPIYEFQGVKLPKDLIKQYSGTHISNENSGELPPGTQGEKTQKIVER